jgi:hypothetical protein
MEVIRDRIFAGVKILATLAVTTLMPLSASANPQTATIAFDFDLPSFDLSSDMPSYSVLGPTVPTTENGIESVGSPVLVGKILSALGLGTSLSATDEIESVAVSNVPSTTNSGTGLFLWNLLVEHQPNE